MGFRENLIQKAGASCGTLVIWLPVCTFVWAAMGAPSLLEITEAFGRGWAAILTACGSVHT